MPSKHFNLEKFLKKTISATEALKMLKFTGRQKKRWFLIA
jgi:purine-nucleoside phosphorylase